MSTKKYLEYEETSKVLEKIDGKVNFGMFLRVARTTLEVTQAEMARILGVPKAMVCDIEKGRQFVSPTLALKIANKAGLSPKQALRLCFQDQLRRAKAKYWVKVEEK